MNPTDQVVQRLLAGHREFLTFLERRLGNRAQAEDVLQDAFVRGLPKLRSVEPASAVKWFYQVLRNAVVDLSRRRGTSESALEQLARDLGDELQPSPDTRDAICRCVGELAKTLKPEYATAISAVEVEGQSLAQFAQTVGITRSNAGVRLFRARQALKKQVKACCGRCADLGCIDCSCSKPPASSAEL